MTFKAKAVCHQQALSSRPWLQGWRMEMRMVQSSKAELMTTKRQDSGIGRCTPRGRVKWNLGGERSQQI